MRPTITSENETRTKKADTMRRNLWHLEEVSYSLLRRMGLVVLTAIIYSSVAWTQDDYFNHAELNWFTIETPHFFVHYHNGEERSARVIAKVAEDIYGPVTSLYHHEPDQKVSIVLKDYDDYSNGAVIFLRQQDRTLGAASRLRPARHARLVPQCCHARVHPYHPDPDVDEIRQACSGNLSSMARLRSRTPAGCSLRIPERHCIVSYLGFHRS